MVEGAGGLEELFSPSYRLVVFDECAKKRRVRRDSGGYVQITLVGAPPKRGTQIGKLDVEPLVGAALAGAVPEGHDLCFAPGEMAGMCVARFDSLAACDELLVGELADGFEHRKTRFPRRLISDQQRFAY